MTFFMDFSEQDMNGVLGEMLVQGEELLCPVYCVFKPTGFFALARNMILGYVSYTSYGRLLFAKRIFGGWSKEAYPVSDASLLKARKNIFGQFSAYAKFPGVKKAVFKFQFSPKVVGCKLPNQEKNAHELAEIITKYESS